MKTRHGGLRSVRYSAIMAILFIILSPASQAALVGGVVGRIVRIWTYTDYGTGDVQVVVETPLATCANGFWLRMTDVGAKQTLANLMSLQATGTAANIYGYDDQLWSGSGGPVCRIYAVANS